MAGRFAVITYRGVSAHPALANGEPAFTVPADPEQEPEMPLFEDHPTRVCKCGQPVVRLVRTAGGVPGRWRNTCAAHSRDAEGGGAGVPETAVEDVADGSEGDRESGQPADQPGEDGPGGEGDQPAGEGGEPGVPAPESSTPAGETS